MLGLPPPDPQAPQRPKTPEELKALLAQEPPAVTPAPTPTGGSRTPEELRQLLAAPPATTPLPHLNITIPTRQDVADTAGRAVASARTLGRQVLDFTADVGLPAAASTMGGAFGFARGGVPGDIAGSIAGQVAGDLAGIQLDAATGRRSLLSPESKARFAAIPEQALWAGAASGVTGPVLRGVSAATRFLFSPIQTVADTARQSMKPGMTDASRFIEGQVMPHEVSSSPTLKILGNIIEGAPATQAEYQAFLAKRRGLFLKKAEDLIATPEPRVERQVAGEVIRDARVNEAAKGYTDLTNLAVTRGEETMDAAGKRAHDILQTGMTDAQRLTADAEMRRGVAQRAYDTAAAESASTWGDFGSTLGPSLGRESMGEKALGLLTRAHEAARQEASAIYNRVWEATKGTKVSLDPLLQRATQLRGEIGEIPGATGVAGRANRAAGIVSDTSGDDVIAQLSGRADVEKMVASMDPSDPRRLGLLNNLAETEAMLKGSADGTLTPQQVHSLKSYYGRMGFAESGGRSLEKGVFKQLWQAADATLKQLPEDTYRTIKTADALHQAMIEDFEDGALGLLAKKEPKDVLAMVLGQVRTGGESNVKKLLDKIGPEGTASVRAEVWNSLTTNPNGTSKSPKDFLSAVKKLDDRAVKALFGGMSDTLPTLQQQMERKAAAEAALKPADQVAAGLEKHAGARVDQSTKAADQLLVDTQRGVTKATDAVATRGDRELRRLHELPTENLVAASLKNADVTGAAKLRSLVGEDGWKKVQSVDLQRLFGRFEESEAPLLTPKAFNDALNARGEEAFVAAHDQATWNALQVFNRSWEKLAKGEAGSTGKMAIQMRSAAAAGALTSATVGGALYLTGVGDLTTSAEIGAASGAAILIGPKILAKIFTSPKMRVELLKGVTAKVRKDQPLVLRAGTQLLRQLAAAGAVGSQGAGPNARVVDATSPAGGRGGGPPAMTFGQGGRAGGPPPIFTPPGTGGPSGGAAASGGFLRAFETAAGVTIPGIGQPPPGGKK